MKLCLALLLLFLGSSFSFTISTNGGKCLLGLPNGAAPRLGDCGNGVNRFWSIGIQMVERSARYIISNDGTKSCLMSDNSLGTGPCAAKAILRAAWNRIDNGNGYFHLQNSGSKKCLTWDNSGAVFMADCDFNRGTQFWKQTPIN